MGCPDSNEIAALVEGTLDDATIARLQDHLDGCSSCFSLVAELARGESSVAATEGGPPAPTWGTTRKIGEYVLVRPLGRGSGGQVWLAHDTNLDRRVAIKFLTITTNPIARDRFRIEVRAIARLSHPNVVTVHRVGEVDGQPYLVSELIRGQPLDALERPVPWRRVREIGIGLARGLAAAHRAGIIHRDIKPSNAIVSNAGEIKLLDFGLAKLHDIALDSNPPQNIDDEHTPPGTTPDLTATGHLLGTPLYMAPEAWRGAPPSFAVDIYSLGAVLYELCTGAPPHPGATVGEIRRAVIHDPPPNLVARVPDIDPGLARVIETCLATSPDDRYASGDELVAALEATLTPTPAPKRRARAWLVAAAAVLAMIGGTSIYVLTRHHSHMAVVTKGPATPTAPQRCSSDRWCWDASWVGSFSDVWGASADDFWIVGERGVVRRNQRGGWSDVVVPTVADLTSVRGTSATDVWIVGAWGTILHWDGKAWREDVSGTHVALDDVLPFAANDVWAIGEGGLALHWDGTSWRAIPTPTTNRLFTMEASGPNDIWVGGYDTCIHWNGQTWSLSDTKSHEIIDGFQVINSHDVWAWGFHSVLRHWDGTQWSVVPVPEVASADPKAREDYPFNGGGGADTGELWLIAKRRGLLHRVGDTWSHVDQATPRELYNLKAFARNDVWAVGAGGAITHWDGKAWRELSAFTQYRGTAGMWASAPDDVWAVGGAWEYADRLTSHGIVMRFDGKAWNEVTVPTREILRGVSGNRDDRWSVGDKGAIVHWHGNDPPTLSPSHTLQDLHGVWVDAPGRAWAVGTDTILRYDNGDWRAVPAPRGHWIGIWGARAGDAWAVGDHGMLRLVGESWQPVAEVGDRDLAAVWGAAANDVWAVGDGGLALHWNGTAWTAIFSDFSEPLASISGSSSDDVWAVSNSDQGGPSIIHWNGSFWTRIERTTHASLDAVVAVGPGEVWAAGSWVSFLHHVPGT